LVRSVELFHDLRRRYGIAFLALVIVGFLARAQAWVAPSYSIDDYAESLVTAPTDLSPLLSQGRYGLAALWWLRAKLGFFGMPVATSSAALSTLCLALAGMLFAAAIVRRPTRGQAFLFGALFSLHPFLTEFFHFAGATLNTAICILIVAAASAAVLAGEATLAATVGAAVAIAVTLSIYQLVAAHLGAVFLLAVVWRLYVAAEAGESVTVAARPLVRMLLTLVGGVVLYGLGFLIARQLSGVHMGARGDMSQLTLAQHAAGFWVGLSHSLWPEPQLIRRGPSAILLVILALSAGAVAWTLARRGRFVSAVAALVSMAAAVVWASGATALAGTIWMVPRVMSPVSLAFAGIVLIGWRIGPGWMRGAFAVGVGLLCFAYVGASNQILFDTRRVNLWDSEQVNRIIGRLEADPQFANVQTLDIVGGSWRRPLNLPTTDGDMNIMALGAEWAKIGVVAESTGYLFSSPTPAEKAEADSLCAQGPAWPAIGSTRIQGKLAVVCLPKP
jgi:hypothetical protein